MSKQEVESRKVIKVGSRKSEVNRKSIIFMLSNDCVTNLKCFSNLLLLASFHFPFVHVARTGSDEVRNIVSAETFP